MLDAVILAAELSRCAPEVGPTTLAAIISVESAGHPWRINSNTPGAKGSFKYTSASEAASAAQRLIASHRPGSSKDSIDMGLMQVNNKNLRGLKMTPAQMFETCTNVKAGAAVLKDCFKRAPARNRDTGLALRQALSCYNTGYHSSQVGAAYASKVVSAAAGHSDPVAILQAAMSGTRPRATSSSAPAAKAGGQRYQPQVIARVNPFTSPMSPAPNPGAFSGTAW